MRAGSILQTFLVSAVASVLFLRLLLDVLGFPQLGGARFHVAHMLWGGLFMLVAIVILISFVTKETRQTAALIGGIGFGTFIDETGKFVTRDYDYFFQPAVAIIYVVFILVYLGTRAIQTRRSYTPTEHLVNALIHMEDVALHDLEEAEAKRIAALLDRSDPVHPLVPVLREGLERSALVPPRRAGLPDRVAKWISRQYRRLALLPAFPFVVIAVFVVDLLSKTVATVRMEAPTFVDWLKIGSWVLSGLFVARGMARIRRSRLAAFRDLEVSVLVAICITHVFSFYKDQFLALIGLGASVLLLVSVRFMIGQERARMLRLAEEGEEAAGVAVGGRA